MGKLVWGGMVCTNFWTSLGNIPHYLVLHTPNNGSHDGAPRPPSSYTVSFHYL